MNQFCPIPVKNNLWHFQCPACSSKSIYGIGKLKLRDNDKYSSSLILQSEVPEIWACSLCKSLFKQNAVVASDAVSLYSNASSNKRWSMKSKNMKRFMDTKTRRCRLTLQDLLAESREVLDVGCNDGLFLDDVRSLGSNTSGIEYSYEARQICAEKGHTVFSSLDEVCFKYDLITAFDLVEHLYDINNFFFKCKELLSPGGKLVILTGNPECFMARLSRENWWYSSFPEHIVFPGLKYYRGIDGMLVETYSVVRHSRHGLQLPFFLLKSLLISLVKGRFNGLAGLWPDHHLIVLKYIG